MTIVRHRDRYPRPAIRGPRATAPAEDHGAIIARIDTLTRTAQASWFGLLSYLSFVGVTLMGVEDKDFFLDEIETQLPLIGVTIPTFLFFAVAPGLGVALFAYLHLHLLKLWEALADATAEVSGAPLSDHLTPWLVTDHALMRKPGALRKRPMQWLVRLVVLALVYWAPPLTLMAFWWRSMPAHTEWLTYLASGLPFYLSIMIALVSWRQLDWLLKGRGAGYDWHGRAFFALLALVLGSVSTFRVHEPAQTYVTAILGKGAEIWEGGDPMEFSSLSGDRWYHAPFVLASASLSGVRLSHVDDTWLGYDAAVAEFQTGWCAAREIPTAMCRDILTPTAALTEAARAHRRGYCTKLFGLWHDPATCAAHLGAEVAGFDPARHADWRFRLTQLKPRDLSAKNFRRAYLFKAQLQGADLTEAKLQGANLVGAELQGAYLSRAQLQEANLSGAEFDAATDLTAVNLSSAAVKFVDFTNVPQIADHVPELFGDGSTRLPEGVTRSDRWPEGELDLFEFYRAWDAWKAWKATRAAEGE